MLEPVAVAPKVELVPADHPAARAWADLCRGARAAAPRAVTPLKAGAGSANKSYVYRLAFPRAGAAFPAADAIVAKRCRAGTAAVERLFHEQVLPRLPVPVLRFFGGVAEPDGGYHWLFLEDAGDVPCGAAHAVRAAEWLAALHGTALPAPVAAALPPRGPEHYLAHAERARDRLAGCCADNPALSADDRAALGRLRSLLDRLASRWVEFVRGPDPAADSVVHGDFVPKNVRVHAAAGRTPSVFALDWETAGRGSGAPDLATLAQWCGDDTGREAVLAAYVTALRGFGCRLDLDGARRLVRLGTLFRLAAAIEWATYRLATEWVDKPIRQMRCYLDRLTTWVERGE
jgi:hypothetical protein